MMRKLMLIILAAVLCIGCGANDTLQSKENSQIQKQEMVTEAENISSVTEEEISDGEVSEETGLKESVHTHSYIEEITTEVTCEVNGLKTYICECGDSYTEVITATGHIYENYISNNDATYLADGTETAICNHCESTDTRTISGSKLKYTYTDLDKIMYAQKTVNVRDLPLKEGSKLGSLSTAQEVKVTGQCNETGWYRIEYDGTEAYVSNSNLTDVKQAEQTALPEPSAPEQQPSQSADDTATANTTPSAGQEVCPYPLYVLFYDNQGFPYFYGKWGGSANMDADNLAKTDACMAEMNDYVDKNFPRSEGQSGMDYFNSISWKSIGRYQEMQVVVRYMGHLHGVSLSKPEERGIPTEGNKIFKK